MEGLKTPVSVRWEVGKARTEGMGLHAATRVFGRAKNTILNWERRFAALHHILFLSSLAHEFLQVETAGDEASTTVRQHVPPDQSSGWTLCLRDRARRFSWALACGKKDRTLFQRAIQTLDRIARTTQDVRIFTDGERRYGNLLFAICDALVKNGKPGRPKQTLQRGVRFRIQHTGSPSQKTGRKRPT